MQLQNKPEDSTEKSTKYNQSGFARSHIKIAQRFEIKYRPKQPLGKSITFGRSKTILQKSADQRRSETKKS